MFEQLSAKVMAPGLFSTSTHTDCLLQNWLSARIVQRKYVLKQRSAYCGSVPSAGVSIKACPTNLFLSLAHPLLFVASCILLEHLRLRSVLVLCSSEQLRPSDAVVLQYISRS